MLWLKENLANVIVALVVVLVISLIIFYLIRQKKQGKSSCGSGCAGCPMSGSCHKKADNDKEKGL